MRMLQWIRRFWREGLCLLLLGILYRVTYLWAKRRPEDSFSQFLLIAAAIASAVGLYYLLRSLWHSKWRAPLAEAARQLISQLLLRLVQFLTKHERESRRGGVLGGRVSITFDSDLILSKPQRRRREPKWRQLEDDRARMRFLYRHMLRGRIRRGSVICSADTPMELRSREENSQAEERLFEMYIGARYDERVTPPSEEIGRIKDELDVR